MVPQNEPRLGLQILVILLWLLSSSLFQRLLGVLIQKHRLSPFAARKTAHVVAGFWVLPLASFVPAWYLAAIPITMILAANTQANLKRGELTPLEQRLFPLVGFLTPLALILYLWRDQRTSVVVLSVLTMTVGDTAAALVGIRFGKHKIPWTGKTIEGAVANFLSSALTLALVGGVLYQMPLILFPAPAAVASILEAVVPGAWDNPLTLVLLLVLLRYPPLS